MQRKTSKVNISFIYQKIDSAFDFTANIKKTTVYISSRKSVIVKAKQIYDES